MPGERDRVGIIPLLIQSVTRLVENTVWRTPIIITLIRFTPASQGTIALQIDTFLCITENDAFGSQGGDKYRTGALKLAFQDEDEQFALNTILWTGNASKDIQRIKDSSYPGRYGCKDLSDSHYGNFSNGLLHLQYGRLSETTKRLTWV